MKHIGKNSFVHPTAVLPSGYYYVGDCCYIGQGVKIIAEPFVLGDYSKIHAGTFVYTQPAAFEGGAVVLGRNAWVGQNSVIDGTGSLIAGDNLGVGIGSQLYSHINNGDRLLGSRFSSTKPMRIGDDVWFVGMCLVSPITADDRCMAMLGSVVTKPMRRDSVYGGNPAVDITSKVGEPFLITSTDERVACMQALVDEFFAQRADLDRGEIVVTDVDIPGASGQTAFNVATRKYTKRFSPCEIEFMRWISGFRAKFTPVADPAWDDAIALVRAQRGY